MYISIRSFQNRHESFIYCLYLLPFNFLWFVWGRKKICSIFDIVRFCWTRKKRMDSVTRLIDSCSWFWEPFIWRADSICLYFVHFVVIMSSLINTLWYWIMSLWMDHVWLRTFMEYSSQPQKSVKRGHFFSHRDFNNLSRKKYFLINIMNRWIPLLLCLQKFVFFLLLRSSCSVWLLNWFISKFKETEAKSVKKFLFCFQMKFSRSNAFCRRRFNEISIFALIFHSNKSSEYVDVCVCARDGIAKLIILQRI